MDDGLKALLARAWRTVPGREANEAIIRARAATASAQAALERGVLDDAASDEAVDAALSEDPDSLPLSRSYELMLGPDATFASFAKDQLPKLVYHLESIGARLPAAAGVLVCVFEGESLHFLQGGEVIEECLKQLGLTAEELSAKYGTGELQTAARDPGPPLALPGQQN
ncbi:MAG: hypothetical protein JST92_01250 [Deltaproteobacteria bacterium]|nr:hypothetical protein [Deltaproteobacteria bacterium]